MQYVQWKIPNGMLGTLDAFLFITQKSFCTKGSLIMRPNMKRLLAVTF